MKAFTMMGRTIKAVYDDLFLCVYLSLLWWIGTILIIPAAPVTLGVQHVANRIANYKRVDSTFFFQAARSYFGIGWLVYIIRVGVPVTIAVNIWFYMNMEDVTWIWLVAIFFMWLLVVSLMVGIYLFPLFWQQDQPSVKMILRNAFILTLQRPLYTFLMLLFIGVLVGLSLIPIVALFLTPMAVAIAMNFALNGILQDIGLAPQPPVVDSRR